MSEVSPKIPPSDGNKSDLSMLPLEKTEDPSARFHGPGSSFRAKLIGSEEVPDSRGDKMCQDSMLKLKALVKASGQHKQKIVINITLDGIKLIDVMTAQVIQQHSVQKISFIARDMTDRRAFGYVYGLGDGKHQFFGIKTAKAAEQVVLTLRDLFEVVYNMKKKEIEEAKTRVVNGSDSNSVLSEASSRLSEQPQQQPGNILVLEQQLETMHQMSDLEVFKSEWNQNLPTSPDTPATPDDMDLFVTNDNFAPKTDASYSEDLAGFDVEALEPDADGGAKLTKTQILAGFSQGFSGSVIQQQSMQQPMQQSMQPMHQSMQQSMQPMQLPIQQALPFSTGQQQQAAFSAGPQPIFNAPQQSTFGNSNPFGGSQSIGMLTPGPRPDVPIRTGAMRPPAGNPAQTGATQNPFGDAFGHESSGSDSLLAPINSQSKSINGSNDTEKTADPFASLIPGMGSGNTNKKDMFKNFQMAKPTERSNTTVSVNFDNYFMKSVGGVPLDTDNTKGLVPTPAPRSTTQGGPTNANQTPQTTQSSDPFPVFSDFNSNPQQPDNSVQSLFG